LITNIDIDKLIDEEMKKQLEEEDLEIDLGISLKQPL
jgi:hypothetical protein